MKPRFSFPLSIVFCLVGNSLQPSSVSAQSITSDGTLPTPTEVTENGNISEITGGTARGSNLFHSFRDFSVGAEGTADFLNADNISNIFSRVTGGNISNIDGLLRTNNASLFLINPAGIIFGAGARLDLGGGSFYGSSADSILFEDGEFNATDLENPPLLTINAPIGLNLRDNPQPITVQSVVDDVGLEVSTGETLALIGGDIEIEGGKITAPGGRVELGGLSAAGTVNFNENGGFTFPDGVARADVTLTNGAVVNVRAGGGGFITVNTNNLELSENSNLLAGIELGMGSPDAQGGDITIDSTGSVSLTNGSQLSIGVRGQGNGGNVIINAKDQVLFDGVGNGFPSAAFSTIREEGEGNAGNIEIKAGSLTLQNEGSLVTSTSGQGNAGNVLVQADGAVELSDPNTAIFNNVERGGRGNGGEINIQAESLSLTNGAQIQSGLRGSSEELPGGRGNGGEVNINVLDTVTFSGVSESGLSSAIFTDVESGAIGNAGNIEIIARSLSLENGAVINSSTFGQGDAGSISIDISEKVLFANDSGALSQVGITQGEQGEIIPGEGNAGNIEVTTANLSLTGGSQLTAGVFGNGDAGEVIINATESVLFQGTNESTGLSSGVFNNVAFGGVGNAGDIEITTDSLTVIDGGGINSIIQGTGNAGKIDLVGRSFSLENGAQISTSTFGQGDAGQVIINARDTITIDGEDPSDDETVGGIFRHGSNQGNKTKRS